MHQGEKQERIIFVIKSEQNIRHNLLASCAFPRSIQNVRSITLQLRTQFARYSHDMYAPTNCIPLLTARYFALPYKGDMTRVINCLSIVSVPVADTKTLKWQIVHRSDSIFHDEGGTPQHYVDVPTYINSRNLIYVNDWRGKLTKKCSNIFCHKFLIDCPVYDWFGETSRVSEHWT